MRKSLAMASLGAALALPAQVGAAGSVGAAQSVSATVKPMLAVSVAADGTVSTASSTIAVSITRRRVGGVLVVTVAPMD